MNVTMHSDVYERLWSCLRTDFDTVITVFLASEGWGYETLSSVARQHHVTAYYNWIGVKEGRVEQVYTEHAEAVVKLIIKTAKEIWLPPFPPQTMRQGKEEVCLDRNKAMDRMKMKRQIGGLFLLWLVHQNQPRPCTERFPIELSLDDVKAIEKFEVNLMNFSKGLSGEVVLGLRRQIMTILEYLKTIGFVNVVMSTDTFGTDDMKMLRNYQQTRKKLAEFGEIDSNKEWREHFLFNGGGLPDVIGSLGQTLDNLEICQKKMMLNSRIARACNSSVIAGRKLATREERRAYFKKLMIGLIKEKKLSLEHPYIKTIFRIFDKVILEAPSERTLKGRNRSTLQQPKTAAKEKSKALAEEEMEMLDNVVTPETPKKNESCGPQFLESIDDFDCEFLDESRSKPTKSPSKEKPGPSTANSQVTPNFWNKMNTEEKKEWVKKFKSNMGKTLNAGRIVTKIKGDIEGLAKSNICADPTDVISKESLAAEAKKLRENQLRPQRKSRAKPKPDLMLSDSAEALDPLLSALRIKGEGRENVLDQFHEIHSNPMECNPEPEQHKRSLGRYMELMPLISEKAVNTDPVPDTAGPSEEPLKVSMPLASASKRRQVKKELRK